MLGEVSAVTQDGDLTWVFLYGHANKNARGINITTKGPRLSGKELSGLLEAMKGEKVAICLNRQSADFLDALKSEDTVVITATDDSQQLNPPLYAKYFLDEWERETSGSLFAIAKRAADATVDYYEEHGLVRAENVQICDGNLRSSYPFEELTDSPMNDIQLSGLASGEATQVADSGPVSPEMDLLTDPVIQKEREDEEWKDKLKAQEATARSFHLAR